jgi:nitric oxide reductase NorD protein
MAEAEDVLLEIAERATAPLRARWRRSLEGPLPVHEPLPVHGPDADGRLPQPWRRELQVFLVALFGRTFVVHDLPPARSRSALLRMVSNRVREEQDHAGVPYTDGRALYVGAPPARLAGDASHLLRSDALCASLLLAARHARESLRWLPEDRLARDLFWIEDASAAETLVTDAMPGLASAFRQSRARARAVRPSRSRASPLERRVEAHLRAALERDEPCRRAPESLREYADALAAEWRREVRKRRYLSVAPAYCFGRPERLRTGSVASLGAVATPGRHLAPRPVRITAAPSEADDETPAREAPLLLPPGDPHGSVAPSGRIAHPEDSGDEDTDVLAEELERLGEVTRVRSSARVKEILEGIDSAAPVHTRQVAARLGAEPARAQPEWDYRIGAYRPAYCVVRRAAAPAGDPAWAARTRATHAALIRRLRRCAMQLRPRLERRRHERQGDQLDLESYVEAYADRLACGVASERLYVDQRRHQRDLAVGLLIDTSASTDRFIATRRRVIDVERESALLFCEAATAVGDRYGVFAFSGTGHEGVRIMELKGFCEPYAESVTRRIAGLAPDAFTRIGGALRHVATELARVPARRRLLLLLSDGAPNDDDEYEGRYGIEDTRRAASELRALGVRLFCVAIDAGRAPQVAHMFGRTGYGLLRDVRRLPEHLTVLYRRLAHG